MPTIRDPEGIETKYLHDVIKPDDLRVLEIGCGDGRLTWQYARPIKWGLGLDPSGEKLATALQECPSTLQSRFHFIQAQAEAIPTSRATFDLAILARAL